MAKFQILYPELSENFSLLSAFWVKISVSEDSPIFAQRGNLYAKKHQQLKLKVFNDTFWPKSNMRVSVERKLLNSEVFRICHSMFVLKIWDRL